MSILSIISLGVVIGFVCGILRFLYLCFRFKPIVVDRNSPKYKAMKDYDLYEDWERDWKSFSMFKK